MLVKILARMSNDEQRAQLLQTLRNKLPSYHLTWLDVRNIVDLFSPHNQRRFDALQLLLSHSNNLTTKIEINDYIYLSDQCTNNNEQLKVRLFEQIDGKLDVRKEKDVERILTTFQTVASRQKIEAIIRSNRTDAISERHEDLGNEQHTVSQVTSLPEQFTTNSILSPTLPCTEELSVASLKRKYSSYDQSCQQIMTPTWPSQEDELIEQHNVLSGISPSSSNSSLSSASDETIPVRTRSFMLAIKHTFERLKETSS